MSEKELHLPSVAESLAGLRQRAGRSQAQVGASMGTTQSGVSRIERQRDLRLSTLGDYVVAIGGRLRLVVEFDAGDVELLLMRPPSDDSGTHREFRVIWQAPQGRSLVHVGWLEYTGIGFRFTYTADAQSDDEFVPFAAFPRLEATYESKELFPFFAVRLATSADPDFEAIVDALGLTQEAATPVELLALASAPSAHDTIQVVPEPVEQADGSTMRSFLVSGVRHAAAVNESVSSTIASLRRSDRLVLVAEPDNEFNSLAIKLASDDVEVGWIPNYLLDELHQYLSDGRRVEVTVLRGNGPDTPWHLRLLCCLSVLPEG